MSEYQNTKKFLLKDILKFGQKSMLLLTKLKIHFHVLSGLNDEPVDVTFYEQQLKQNNQQEFRIEKAIKRKCDKLYVKWKGYNNSFNGWIDKKDIL